MRLQINVANPSMPEAAPARAVGHVLGTPELLRAIFDVFKPRFRTDDDSLEDDAVHVAHRAALAACARVSRHFSQHALDVLWSCIDGNVPALFIFFPSIRVVAGREWTITGNIIPAEWARFRTFATRVRELSYRPYDSWFSIDPLVWTILARQCPGDPLFPRLRLLDVPAIAREDITPIILNFLSPSLRSVSFVFVWPEDAFFAGMKTFFQTLVDVAPELTELYWHSHRDMLPLEEASFMAEISRLRHLRVLRLTQPGLAYEPSSRADTVFTAPLPAIIAVRSLRTLVLDVGHCVDVNHTSKPVGNSTLDHLRTLHLMGAPGEKLATLVHSLCLPALESLVLDTLGFDSEPHRTFEPLSSQLVRLCANLPPTLQNFDWQYPAECPLSPQADAPSDLHCILRPLLRFALLRHVRFGIPRGAESSIYITDDALFHFAAAWPNIQTLQIISPEWQSWPHNVAYPTFAALVTFAQRCPMLSSLVLPGLDFSSLGPDPAVSESIPLMRYHPLQQLQVKAAVCGSISASGVAILLDRLFPQLDSNRVYINPNHRSVGYRFSSEITRILEATRGVREHDTMRVKLPASAEEVSDRSAARTTIPRA